MIDCQHFDCEAALFQHHVDWVPRRNVPCAVLYVAARMEPWANMASDAQFGASSRREDLPGSAVERGHTRFVRLVTQLLEQFPCIHSVSALRKLPDLSSWDRPGTVVRIQTNYFKGNIDKYDIELWGICRIYFP